MFANLIGSVKSLWCDGLTDKTRPFFEVGLRGVLKPIFFLFCWVLSLSFYQRIYPCSCDIRAEYECFQIELAKNYGVPEWREDLKKVLLKSGVENKSMVFLFSDTQVTIRNFRLQIHSGKI